MVIDPEIVQVVFGPMPLSDEKLNWTSELVRGAA
jgi:hypothetical protein